MTAAMPVGDPLFTDGVDATVFLVVAGKTLVVFAFLLVSVIFYVWFMRKVIADMQNRLGPMTAGPFGILQTIADGIKLIHKEETIPDAADRPTFRLAPYAAMVPVFLMFAIVPVGYTVSIAGRPTYLQLAEIPVGVLLILAMSGIGLYGKLLAGWASGSKYPLLGSVRASAQLLSYEAALGLAIVGVLLRSGSLSTREIVDQQAWQGIGSIFTDWNLFPCLIFFVLFVIAGIAEINHPPFDLVEAEQELVGGYHTEYSSFRFATFFLAEFMALVVMSAIAVTLFLGGPSGPSLGFVAADSPLNTWVMPITWFLLKLLVLLYASVWVRASLPRLRYDQLMNLGWKYMIEIAVLAVLVFAAIIVADEQGWNVLLTASVAAIVALLAYGFIWLSVPKDRELEQLEDIA